VLQSEGTVSGIVCQTKSGQQTILADVVIDTSGDGDVAALAGADFMLGRDGDGEMQPMTTYFRILNVDYAGVVRDCEEHPDDVNELVVPEGTDLAREDYTLIFYMKGFSKRIAKARAEGFNWIVPKDYIVVKAGLLPGEINVNVTRYQGNGLDARTRSAAVIDLRKQAYNTYEFLKKYVGGFEDSHLLDVAPVLGVRETRRIIGDHILTEEEVISQARFPDAIALTNAPMDIHDPGGAGGTNISTGAGYGIPYRTLLPASIEGMLLGGRCISVDHRAFGSTRNTPPCAMTGQAAGIAAAIASRKGVTPRQLDVAEVQAALESIGVVLGTKAEDRLEKDDSLVPAGQGSRI
ncbi:MAG: hypothetical protein JWP32_954, partial [Schumannella sp.]|nr:hypothetical protein [Schumannella sp.]